MNFKTYLKLTAQKVEKELDEILSQFVRNVKKTSPKLLPLAKAFINSCKGGKRIRGVLIQLGYELASQTKAEDIYKVAAAYEIFHTAILAHDDIIDKSLVRRGQPSLYQSLGGNHFGLSQSICLGDAGFFLAIKTISDSNFPAKDKVKALNWFSDTMLDTALGEMLDVEKGDVITIAKLKTARYSVCGPLVLGAILGKGDHDLIRRLDEFGENLGIAFQIQDDILGVFGSLEQTGKSITSDIEEGKNTLLYIYALKQASTSQKKDLKQYYGKGKISQTHFLRVKQIFKETNALDYARMQAVEYANKAKKVISSITTDKILISRLNQMLEFLIEREK